MTSYKYEFELSSKRRTFLWLYQVLPNIDLINEIYKLKIEAELDQARLERGLLPTNIIASGSFHVDFMDHQHKVMLLNALHIKLIQEDGFICTFFMDEDHYTDYELEEINNGNWISVVPNINRKPIIKTKIKIMNLIFVSILCLVEDLYIRLNNLHNAYMNTKDHNIFRIGYDQRGGLYIPTTMNASFIFQE